MTTNNSNNLNGPGTAGQVVQSQGNGLQAYSTATYPTTATGTGTILRADGTNWVATTATYPNTNTTGDVIYSSATNTYSNLAINTALYGAQLMGSPTLPYWNHPRNTLWLYDDFFGSQIAANYGWNQGVANGGAVNMNVTTWNTNANPGIVDVQTNGNAAGAAVYDLGSGKIILGGGTLYWECCFRVDTLSGSGDTYIIRLGLGDCGANNDNNNGVYFEYTDTVNSGNFQIKTAAGGSRTTANTNNAPATSFNKIAILVNAAATSVAYFFNDVQCANSPIALTIPTLSIKPNFQIVKTGGANGRNLAVDYMLLWQNLTSSR